MQRDEQTHGVEWRRIGFIRSSLVGELLGEQFLEMEDLGL
jgi:hypothetical protein